VAKVPRSGRAGTSNTTTRLERRHVLRFSEGRLRTSFTVTRVNVTGILYGSVIKVRQMGSRGGPLMKNRTLLLEPGNAYVAFLDRFTFGPGKETDPYMVVGVGAGLFHDPGGMLEHQDPESPDLPAHTALPALQRLVSSSSESNGNEPGTVCISPGS